MKTLREMMDLIESAQTVAGDPDPWFRVTVKTPNGKNHNIQVPANSHGTAKKKALAYCAKNGIAGAEFVSAMRMPTLDEQDIAEDQLEETEMDPVRRVEELFRDRH